MAKGSGGSGRGGSLRSLYSDAASRGLVRGGAKTDTQRKNQLARALQRRIDLQPQLSRASMNSLGGDRVNSALAANSREIDFLSRVYRYMG